MTKTISLDLIIPDLEQPRKHFSGEKITELANSISKEGVLTPLIVEDNYDGNKYLLIDGERRYRASKQLNLEKVPVEIIKGPLTHEERTIKRFHIQVQHQSWSELDKSRAIFEYKKMTKKTIVEIAENLNLHVSKVHAYLSVVDFTEVGQKLIIENNIDFTYLLFLIRIVKHYTLFSGLRQEEIEIKLIQKIKNNIFYTASDIQQFSKQMSNKDNEKEKILFLENDDYTLEKYYDKTVLNEKFSVEKLYKILVRVDYELSEVINEEYSMSNEHIKMLKTVKEKIEQLL